MGNKTPRNKDVDKIWPEWLVCFDWHKCVLLVLKTQCEQQKLFFSTCLQKQTGLNQRSPNNEKVDFLQNQRDLSQQRSIQSTTTLDKYLKLHLVNNTFTLHFNLTELNAKWSSPVTATVALSWSSFYQVRMVWPHATKPSKCNIVFNSKIMQTILDMWQIHRVFSLTSTSRPTKCSNGKTISKLKFTVQVIK